jgi:hypothetical protein
MRKSVLLAAMFLAACSSNRGDQENSRQAFDVQEEKPTAPGVDVTAAPGVAFAYRYAFRLPGNRIAQVQEAHAQTCEKLGIYRCRITGMRYRLVNQKDIQAMLALRLDPKVARQFGKDATELVKKAEGMLVDQEISGEDVGTRISGANRSEERLREELRRIEAELARPVPMVRGNVAPQAAVDRQSLLNRAQELRQQLSSLGESRASDQEALAGTPMVFNYGSGSVVPGFDVRSPIRDALQQAADNFVGGFAAILVILITLIPWLLLVGLGVWAFRRMGGRLGSFASGYRSEAQSGGDETPAVPRRRRSSTDTAEV